MDNQAQQQSQPITPADQSANPVPPKPPTTIWKKMALFILLPFVLVFVIYFLVNVYIGFFGLEHKPLQIQNLEPDDSPKPSTVPASDLKTYTNTKYNYSIQYPAELLLDGDPTSDLVAIDKQITIEVSPNDPGNCRTCSIGGGHRRNVVVNDISGYEFEGYIARTGKKVPQEFLQVVLPHNNVFYIFTVNELKTDHKETINRELADLTDVDPKAVALFRQILSTFKFTN